MWLKRDRRKVPRDQPEPTYVVERDAPPWEFPDRYDRKWSRRAYEIHEQHRYDAYPDHERPFGEEEQAGEPSITGARRPPSVSGKVKLMLYVGEEDPVEVPFDHGFLELFDPSNRMHQARIARNVAEVIDAMTGRKEAQGLVEYALILALIAIIAIVALLFLGGQISNALFEVGSSVTP